MKYQVMDNIIVDSSRTAKSYLQQSSRVIDLINSFEYVPNILDYGCGKMRYSLSLNDKCAQLTIIDSELQLGKIQMIHGEKSSIRSFVKGKYPEIRVMNNDEILKDNVKYDIIFCSNVLSAIPDTVVRSQLLSTIHDKLKDNGKAYFITQYTNSFYCQLKKRENSFQYLDGILCPSNGRASYYGIIGKEKLRELLELHRFNIQKVWNVDQSTYAEVSR